MTLIAGIRNAMLGCREAIGVGNAMAADAFEQRVGLEGHMAVVAQAPTGIGCMTGMCEQGGRLRQLFVTVGAGLILMRIQKLRRVSV